MATRKTRWIVEVLASNPRLGWFEAAIEEHRNYAQWAFEDLTTPGMDNRLVGLPREARLVRETTTHKGVTRTIVATFVREAERPRELLNCGHYVWEHGPRGSCQT